MNASVSCEQKRLQRLSEMTVDNLITSLLRICYTHGRKGCITFVALAFFCSFAFDVYYFD